MNAHEGRPSLAARTHRQHLRHAKDFCERRRLRSRPERCSFAVTCHLRAHETVRGPHTFHCETAGRNSYARVSRHDFLTGFEKCFQVARERVEKLTFMQQCAVEIAEVFLPKELLAGEHEFFQFAMRGDEEMRCRSFEANATFDSQNRVTKMNAAPNPISPANRVQRVNRRDRALRLSIELRRHTFVEGDGYRSRWKRRINFPCRIRLVGQVLPGIMRLLSANTRTPHSFVDAILLESLGKCEAARGEERAFFGAAQAKVSDRRENLELWRERAKRHVETDLIVPRSGRPVRKCDRIDLARVTHDPARLANSLGANGEWIQAATQNVTRYKEAQIIAKQLVAHIDRGVRLRAKFACKLLDPRQLRITEAAGIDRDRMDLASLFAQPENTKRSIQSAGKGEQSAGGCVHGQSKRRSVVVARERRRSLIQFLLSASVMAISVKASCPASGTVLLAVTATG